MIHFHATRGYTWTIEKFIASWDPTLADHVTATTYEDLDLRAPIPAGLHVFTDLERLLGPERAYVQQLHDRMVQHPESYAALNDPARWTGRLGLNQAMSDAGLNDYRAFRLADVPDDLQLPAFVRWENEHTGSLGDPVASRDELSAQVAAHASGLQRWKRRKLLVVEQLDVRSEDGLFRKYSAQKIGDRIFPRHLFFSQKWVTKYSDLIEEHMILDEREYLADFPHEKEVAEAFRLAGLDYGRIDYGFLGDRMQVWEINTNPVLVKRRNTIERGRLRAQKASAFLMRDWMKELSAAAPSGPARRLFGPVEGLRWQAQVTATRPYSRWRRADSPFP